MKIREVMNRSIHVINRDTTVQEAAEKMRALNVGVLPVYDGRNIEGILTDRDIAVRSSARGDDPNDVKVSGIMSRDVEWCYDDQDVSDAIEHMEQRKIRRMLVLDHEQKPIGIVSLSDLIHHGAKEAACDVLEKSSEPATV